VAVRRTQLASALLVIAFAAGACGPDDGRRLAEPNPDLTAVPVPTTAVIPAISGEVPLQGEGPGGLLLSSPDFSPGGTMPTRSGCDGELSPRLEWTESTRRTTELALVVQDIDADGVAQWVVTGISPDPDRIGLGELPPGAEARANSAGVQAWTSPCPTDGFAHEIVFTLYALDQPLPVTSEDPASVVNAIQGASYGSASLLGRASPGVTG
jgi:phosphatidylethanolamine-binding protein (PEBP) family uncharacterized protein